MRFKKLKLKTITALILILIFSICCFGCLQSVGQNKTNSPTPPAPTNPDQTNEDNIITLEYEKADLNNPLRGIAIWNTSSTLSVPFSLEYLPIPLHQIVNVDGSYDFSYSDTRLDAIANRGNHTILRFLLWEPPDSYLPSAYKNAGVKTLTVEGEEVPDFSDDLLIDKLCEFISAVGDYYDGDPRIGFLQLGLMGRWGEWNYGGEYPPVNVPSAEQYNRIYEAFDNAFDTTKLQARNPNIGSPKLYNIGYHDDNFMFSTLGSGGGDFKYLCEQGNISSDLWKTESFGAELSGYENGDFFSTEDKRTRFENSVKYQNFSFMMWQKYYQVLDTDLWNTHKNVALESTRLLGYEFYVESISVANNNNNTVTVKIKIKNTGNAPFYYNWDSLIELYNDTNLIKSQTANWNITSIMPNESKTFSQQISLQDSQDKAFNKISFSIVNPLSEKSDKAKNLNFANKAENITDGKLIVNL